VHRRAHEFRARVLEHLLNTWETKRIKTKTREKNKTIGEFASLKGEKNCRHCQSSFASLFYGVSLKSTSPFSPSSFSSPRFPPL
jgi:hypothetical protein